MANDLYLVFRNEGSSKPLLLIAVASSKEDAISAATEDFRKTKSLYKILQAKSGETINLDNMQEYWLSIQKINGIVIDWHKVNKRKEFIESLENASRIVAGWPKWKRDIKI